ncbi:MAG: cytochrome c1 [Gammaproteobacteria bacterium]|nr:MAG: cytochrome c1 [Gammaproteobacteria bacterium]RLA15969.1 MAG: cytochrome c1 [Gammaproteobacteria bacterium]
MRKLIRAILLLIAPGALWASGAAVDVHFAVNLNNEAGLQRGARTFVNYCVSCHSAKYMRYSQMATDIGLSEDLVEANMVFTGRKVTDHMLVALDPVDAKRWLGQAPPDLTLVARSRGADWLFAYLTSFHRDAERPWGVNNPVLPGTTMPAVLSGLQGEQVIDEHGQLHQVSEGTLSTEEFDGMVTDLVNFLVYVGEPAKLVRGAMGVKVILFLMLFTLLAYLLKKEYWKDIH